MVGHTLAHYRILEKIGSGGMGDVYLAKDTNLARNVALKVLPPELADNEDRRARFKREAQAIAALNHPNIITVYSVEEADGVHFITMELVKGKTLSELLPKSGFALNRFLEIAIPLADAVAAAHQEGITHRDLKPDNVMMGDDGRIKVLDFGLAKPSGLFAGQDVGSHVATAAQTEEGTIVGTVHYMSPEQAQGQPVDARSDIFSLGIIFYEMATGRQPFGGDNPAAVLSSIIKDEPPSLAELDPELPRDLVKIVRRCLTKEPLRRFQTTIDLRNDLEELKQDVASGQVAARPLSRKSRWPVVAGAVVAILAIALIVLLLPTGDPIPLFSNPVQVTSDIGLEDYPTWSPDGGRLAYHSNRSGNFDIWVSQVSGGSAINLTPNSSNEDRFPSWSPDGNQIAFASRELGRGTGCYVVSSLGGPARKMSDGLGQPVRPQWSPDGTELACGGEDENGSFIEFISFPGRESRRLPVPGRSLPHDPSWSPDGRFLAFVDGPSRGAQMLQLWIVRVADGEAFSATDGLSEVWSPIWLSNAHWLYFVSNQGGGGTDLWRRRIANDGTPQGDPERVTAGLGIRSGVFLADGKKFAYSNGRRVANVWRVPIMRDRPATWVDAQQITFDQAFVECMDVSPDGKRLVVNSNRGGYVDLWTMPSDGGEMEPLTTDLSPDWCPVWSPEGNEIAFFGYRAGNRDIWVISADGGPARQMTRHDGGQLMPAWSPDGSHIAYHSNELGQAGVWIVPSVGREPRQLTSPGYLPEWSPDGQRIVFNSGRGGTTRLWQVAVHGESDPELLIERRSSRARFSADGTKLYFLGIDDIWVHQVADGSEIRLTDLTGKRGQRGSFALTTDDEYLYFTWQEDLGDIWLMDVVTDER